MELVSSAFENNGDIPSKYTCEGENVNPSLEFVDVPDGAKSLALTMFDPDIPQEFKDRMGIAGWDHWTLWDIPTSVTEIAENSVPKGAVQGRDTRGDIKYSGPCPPKDKEPPRHRYIFTLYALDLEKVDLAEGATQDELKKAIERHVLEKAELVGFYEKKA